MTELVDLVAENIDVERTGMALWRGTSETSVCLRTRLKLSAAEGVREAVLAGSGFAIASRWMFAPELKSGDVAGLLEGWASSANGSLGDLSFGSFDEREGPSFS